MHALERKQKEAAEAEQRRVEAERINREMRRRSTARAWQSKMQGADDDGTPKRASIYRRSVADWTSQGDAAAINQRIADTARRKSQLSAEKRKGMPPANMPPILKSPPSVVANVPMPTVQVTPEMLAEARRAANACGGVFLTAEQGKAQLHQIKICKHRCCLTCISCFLVLRPRLLPDAQPVTHGAVLVPLNSGRDQHRARQEVASDGGARALTRGRAGDRVGSTEIDESLAKWTRQG